MWCDDVAQRFTWYTSWLWIDLGVLTLQRTFDGLTRWTTAVLVSMCVVYTLWLWRRCRWRCPCSYLRCTTRRRPTKCQVGFGVMCSAACRQLCAWTPDTVTATTSAARSGEPPVTEYVKIIPEPITVEGTVKLPVRKLLRTAVEKRKSRRNLNFWLFIWPLQTYRTAVATA